ncbi:2-dehydro-3-deoxygalactonokinase [Brevirhabdus sp.]|uniref:2-dehydro-3-deoxygalactonokinase n=1 Tax=Brevirhabdus sp. TaxID=2004514 RepID=UPI00405987AA
MAATAEVSGMEWIGVLRGPRHLRAWAIGPENRLLAEARGDSGPEAVDQTALEARVLALIAPWLGRGTDAQDQSSGSIPVIFCDDSGHSGAPAPVPASVPAPPLAAGLAPVPTRDARIELHAQGGLIQAAPADAMQGAAVRIAGFLALNPQFDGVLCDTGTHTVWAHVSAGEVVSFQTFMTAELFDAITGHTVLRHSVSTRDSGAAGADERPGAGGGAPVGDAASDACGGAFDDAMSDLLSRPERLAAGLMTLRAGNNGGGSSDGGSNDGGSNDGAHDAARARLWGMLIGAELAAARPYWLGQQLVVIGPEGPLPALYARALDMQGAGCEVVAADRMTVAGLCAARSALRPSVKGAPHPARPPREGRYDA